jgi:hypothetical protein
MSTCNVSFVDLLTSLSTVLRECAAMNRLFLALHGTLGSYLGDALHEGSADSVACLHVPRA